MVCLLAGMKLVHMAQCLRWAGADTLLCIPLSRPLFMLLGVSSTGLVAWVSESAEDPMRVAWLVAMYIIAVRVWQAKISTTLRCVPPAMHDSVFKPFTLVLVACFGLQDHVCRVPDLRMSWQVIRLRHGLKACSSTIILWAQKTP